MDVVTSQRWMLRCLNFICGSFYITPLKQIFLPGIPWSLLLDTNGTFLHHTRGWTFLLDTMVVVTGASFFWRWLRYASVCYLWGCWCNLASVALRLCHTEPKIQLMRHNRSSSSIETHREANFHPQYKLSHLYLIVRAKRAKKIRQKFQKKFD